MSNSQSAWRFSSQVMPQAIIAGWGCRSALKDEVEGLGLRRLLLVCSPSLKRTTAIVDDLSTHLGERVAATFDGVRPNNPDREIAAAANLVRSRDIDGIVSIGGGAAHDAAKALALVLPSRRDILSFTVPISHSDAAVSPLPLLTIPSTFSASEVLGGGAVTDVERRQKRLFGHPMLTPRRVFLDGEVVASTPRAILAQSGLNAVHHCLEALYATGRGPVTDAFALAALAELFAVLPAIARDDVSDPVDMQRAIQAASLAGLTYATSGLGIGHAVCHVLSGRYALSHAAANAVMVRHSLRFNREVAAAPLARAARQCVGVPADLSDAQAVEALIAALDRLCTQLGAPTRLRDIGLPHEDFAAAAAEVGDDPCFGTNPRPASIAEVAGLLEEAW